jgi:hypothetical protein
VPGACYISAVNDRLLPSVRIAFALLVVGALAYMVWTLIQAATFNALNLFTFFTVLSNLLAAAIFAEGGRRALAGRSPVPDLWRGAAVVYMAVTYLVFAVLLSDAQEAL